jgi:hypothetical protein
MNTSSKYHLSPGFARRRLRLFEKLAPNLLHQRRMLSYDTTIARSARSNSTSRKLRLKNVIEPDGMIDDRGREAMTDNEDRGTVSSHLFRPIRLSLPARVTGTMPFRLRWASNPRFTKNNLAWTIKEASLSLLLHRGWFRCTLPF